MRKFELGQTVATQGAAAAVDRATLIELLDRHASGDWGTVGDDDAKANDIALAQGERIMSTYELPEELEVWIITEWNRSVTTVLLPEEY